jgi:hypothetical protein
MVTISDSSEISLSSHIYSSEISSFCNIYSSENSSFCNIYSSENSSFCNICWFISDTIENRCTRCDNARLCLECMQKISDKCPFCLDDIVNIYYDNPLNPVVHYDNPLNPVVHYDNPLNPVVHNDNNERFHTILITSFIIGSSICCVFIIICYIILILLYVLMLINYLK